MKQSRLVFFTALTCGALALLAEGAHAQPQDTQRRDTEPRHRESPDTEPRDSRRLCAGPWRRLGDNARNFVRPYSLVLTGAAALPPLTMSPTGADHDLRRFSQIQLGGSYWPESVSLGAPYVFYPASMVFYTVAALADYCPGQTRASAIIQATSESLLVIGFLKWTTGRVWPLGGRSPNDPEVLDHPEDARAWAPFQNGLAAFPSGHTAFFFAVAGAFRASSADIGIFRYAGYPLAAAMGFAMWYGDHHWVSDVLSGALLGEAIGAAAGKSWAAEDAAQGTSFLILPTRSGFVGTLAGTF